LGFQPRSDYLRLYHRIDIALDPYPYIGITTTCDSLWMGVPVLTLPGALPASRAGLSLLSTVGLPDLAPTSENDYLRLACELAADLPRLAAMRATLRPQMLTSLLMNAPRFAQNVEAAYRSMWQAWCAPQPSPHKE
jgi:protein O-GlcNAc transferase